MRIAVDFDGTIVEHAYPEIGKTRLFAFETLRMLQKEHQLILWTYRAGKELNDAVEFCHKNGVVFYAVNRNYPEEVYEEENISRKIDADVYIDDKNIGGLPDWGEIWHILNPDEDIAKKEQALMNPKKRFGFFEKKKKD